VPRLVALEADTLASGSRAAGGAAAVAAAAVAASRGAGDLDAPALEACGEREREREREGERGGQREGEREGEREGGRERGGWFGWELEKVVSFPPFFCRLVASFTRSKIAFKSRLLASHDPLLSIQRLSGTERGP